MLRAQDLAANLETLEEQRKRVTVPALSEVCIGRGLGLVGLA